MESKCMELDFFFFFRCDRKYAVQGKSDVWRLDKRARNFNPF
jgi:hypothetical protein